MQILFALDHLAIRMERNTNNLLVLGGYGHGRVRGDDVPCSTVILVAAQQIEQFDRVRLGVVEEGIGIAARVVHDVAHLLAELLDNATSFSSPGTRVGVTVWRLHDRAVVQIVDEGVGIQAERRARYNAALAESATVVGDVRAMGLHVVARLAARHGIGVELRDGSPGTIAEVTLPSDMLTEISGDTVPARPETPRGPLGLSGPPRQGLRTRPSGRDGTVRRDAAVAPGTRLPGAPVLGGTAAGRADPRAGLERGVLRTAPPYPSGPSRAEPSREAGTHGSPPRRTAPRRTAPRRTAAGAPEDSAPSAPSPLAHLTRPARARTPPGPPARTPAPRRPRPASASPGCRYGRRAAPSPAGLSPAGPRERTAPGANRPGTNRPPSPRRVCATPGRSPTSSPRTPRDQPEYQPPRPLSRCGEKR
ncbi:ATP-binding protein [Streptomyces sp. M19]